MLLPHTYMHFTYYIHYSNLIFSLFILHLLPLFISHLILHLLPLFDINAKGVCHMAMPKCDKKSKCTFKISAIVLSQFSYNTLFACNAVCISANNSIMWSSMEKLLSWMSVLACAMCFCNASMFGRIMPWMFTSVALILASSLNNYTWIFLDIWSLNSEHLPSSFHLS